MKAVCLALCRILLSSEQRGVYWIVEIRNLWKIDVYIFSGGLEANRLYLLIISNSNYKFILPWRLFRFWTTLNWGLDKINGRFWNFGLERMNGRFWNFVFDSTNGRFSNFCLEMMNGRLSFKLWSSSMSDKTRAKYYKCKVWLVINI